MPEDLEAIRSRLSGLHFAQEALSEHERETLHLAEDLLRRIDALRDLCDEAVEQPTNRLTIRRSKCRFYCRPERGGFLTEGGSRMEKTLNWEPANSDTIEKFCWVPEYGDLLVSFRKGGEYVYHEVPDALVKKLRGKRHVWSKVRTEITKLPFERLGTIRREPLKGRGTNKTMYGKAVAESTPKVTRARRTSK